MSVEIENKGNGINLKQNQHYERKRPKTKDDGMKFVLVQADNAGIICLCT